MVRHLLTFWTLHAALCTLGASSLACGGGNTYVPPAAPDYSLSEARAMAVVARVLEQWDVAVIRHWRVRLPAADAAMTVDIRLGNSPFGIEWVSPEDRLIHHGLPAAEPNGTLRLVSGWDDDTMVPVSSAPHATGPSDTAQVLLLDHSNYRYSGEVMPGTRPGAGMGLPEVEAQLERDVRDFLEYVQSQQPNRR